MSGGVLPWLLPWGALLSRSPRFFLSAALLGGWVLAALPFQVLALHRLVSWARLWMIAVLVGAVLSLPLVIVGACMLAPLIVAAAQWIVLFRKVERASLWLALAWVTQIMRLMFLNVLLDRAFAGAICFALPAGLEAAGLLFLVQRPRRRQSPAALSPSHKAPTLSAIAELGLHAKDSPSALAVEVAAAPLARDTAAHGAWIQCRHCGLRHRHRAAGSCPRCHGAVEAGDVFLHETAQAAARRQAPPSAPLSQVPEEQSPPLVNPVSARVSLYLYLAVFVVLSLLRLSPSRHAGMQGLGHVVDVVIAAGVCGVLALLSLVMGGVSLRSSPRALLWMLPIVMLLLLIPAFPLQLFVFF
jgi:hypothetical protein